MTDYRAALERLDAKAGKIHTLADCNVAYLKSINTPEILDERDLTLIGFVHGEKGVSEARQRQMASFAANAEAQAQLTKAAPSAPVVTKSVNPEPPKTLAEFVERFGTKPVTWAGLMKTLEGTDAIFIKEIKTLRQANKDLEARILELEAQAASLKVDV